MTPIKTGGIRVFPGQKQRALRVCGVCAQLLSLTLDGLTGVSQDHMRAHYQTGSNHMMLNVNLWSTLFLGAGKERRDGSQGTAMPCPGAKDRPGALRKFILFGIFVCLFVAQPLPPPEQLLLQLGAETRAQAGLGAAPAHGTG